MNEQELQLAFIQFLAQKTGAKTLQELESVIQQLGEEGLKQAYAEFMQMMLQQLVLSAKFGAKLDYIKLLRGRCPDGYEMLYYKKGGRLCKRCMKKQAMQEGGEVPENPIDAFKCGHKMKNSIQKNEGGKKFPLIEKDKKGNNKTVYYKDEATRDSIAANKYNDLEVQTTKPGSYKKGKWTPDRTKAPYKKK